MLISVTKLRFSEAYPRIEVDSRESIEPLVWRTKVGGRSLDPRFEVCHGQNIPDFLKINLFANLGCWRPQRTNRTHRN
jgi:hypothetical protein